MTNGLLREKIEKSGLLCFATFRPENEDWMDFQGLYNLPVFDKRKEARELCHKITHIALYQRTGGNVPGICRILHVRFKKEISRENLLKLDYPNFGKAHSERYFLFEIEYSESNCAGTLAGLKASGTPSVVYLKDFVPAKKQFEKIRANLGNEKELEKYFSRLKPAVPFREFTSPVAFVGESVQMTFWDRLDISVCSPVIVGERMQTKTYKNDRLVPLKKSKRDSSFDIYNRRYTGSKYKLLQWIFELVVQNCEGRSFCDLFAGTGCVAYKMADVMDKIFINDLLYSNEVIYKAFFDQMSYSQEKLEFYKVEFQNLNTHALKENYISENFGDKFFSKNDARVIGAIREKIYLADDVNEKERNILLASLLYSLDKAANTVGHYDAYFRKGEIADSFMFELINPCKYEDKSFCISRSDANQIARKIKCDIVYIDPPYNSRQYSRFYHVLENITKWEKPELFGTALKPAPENMSDYCRSVATVTFEDLIKSLDCRFIVVSYNNTYESKSESSKNKITLENIKMILESKGEVKIFEKEHSFFNAGKTEFKNHKEFIFIVKVKK